MILLDDYHDSPTDNLLVENRATRVHAKYNTTTADQCQDVLVGKKLSLFIFKVVGGGLHNKISRNY